MGVSYNLGQLMVCLETWLWTPEKVFNKKTLNKKILRYLDLEKRHISKHISSTTNWKLMGFGLPCR
jgi:hypothetical protein